MRATLRAIAAYLLVAATIASCGGGGGGGGSPTSDNTIPPPPPLSNNASLVNLSASTGPLVPGFDAIITSYSQETQQDSLMVTATAADPSATILVNGATVASGSSSNPIALAVGGNGISIVVTAEDGVTRKSYSIAVTRTVDEPPPLSNNASLANLSVSTGPLVPGFDATITSYSQETQQDTLMVTATAADPSATILVNGATVASGSSSNPIALAVGGNGISIVVTAEDGVTRKSYSIAVTRTVDEPPPLSNNASLANLSVSTGPLVPGFDAMITSYSQETQQDNLTVMATAADPKATILVNGDTVVSGSSSNPIALAVGDNGISIVVTAEDGITQNSYSILVTRIDNDATLSSLEISPGSLDQVFLPNQFEYSAQVGYLDNSITVTAISASALASVVVNGERVESGVASSGIDLIEGPNSIDITVTAGDGTTQLTYTLEVTRSFADEWAAQVYQDAYVKASNSTGGIRFGRAVSISADTMVIGAPMEAGGAVYVFVRDENRLWKQEAYIKGSNTEGGDSFGESVSIYGDTLVVGAVNEDSAATGIDGDQFDNSASAAGAVYVYERSGTTWAQTAYIKPRIIDAGDGFGGRVAVSSTRIAIGAGREDSSNQDPSNNGDLSGDFNSGAVYVFRRSGPDSWTQEAYLKSVAPERGAGFGTADLVLNENTLVAVEHRPVNDKNSAAQVFSNLSGGWQTEARFSTQGRGASVAVWGDTIAVSDYTWYLDRGKVDLYRRGGDGIWQKDATLTAFNADEGDHFGFALDMSDEYLAIGAIGESSNARGINGDAQNNSAPDSGAVYLYRLNQSGEWIGHAYIKASNAESGDWFAARLALDGDTLVVTAFSEDSMASGINGDETDNSARASGAAYVFTF